jgi:predicted Rossmann fold nucleotide-binding protein DprA/Smf involved in DNA uptake
MEDFNDFIDTRKASPRYKNHITEENLLTEAYNNGDIESIILQQIGSAETFIDDIIAVTGAKASDVIPVISKLELEGKLMKSSYNKIVKII